MIAVECTCRRRAATAPATSIVAFSRKVIRYALPCSAAVHPLPHAVETSHSRTRRLCNCA
jgi:hypothetical protein